MAYAEKRGKLWRARWRGPDGTLESKPGFKTRRAAEDYGRDQEAAIRANIYVDPRAGQITLTEWVNQWYAGLDLELNTMSTYKYLIEVLILPQFGNRSLASLTTEEIAAWEKGLTTRGYVRKTAREARSVLTTALTAAVPRHLQSNPATRRRGTGRKGQRRIERAERAEKTWPSAVEALLFAERCAVLSGDDSDFVMVTTIAYTGARWSEALGLSPKSVRDGELDLAWKLYELNARFYRGRPKDGSIRTVDMPPFLAVVLDKHVKTTSQGTCTCRNATPAVVSRRTVRLPDPAGHPPSSRQLHHPSRAARGRWLVPGA
jgi:integrase